MDKLKSGSRTLNPEYENKIENRKLQIDHLFALALDFFKNKSGKVSQISYHDKLKLVALAKQVVYGPFVGSKLPELGIFDLIGKDRRTAWEQLGCLSRNESMENFVTLLENICPSFLVYIQAVKHDTDKHYQMEAEESLFVNDDRLSHQQDNKTELQRRRVQDALNQQTFKQFKEYAVKQFPRNPEQQAVLIRQLQNEHYHQYMQKFRAEISVDSKYANMVDGERNSKKDPLERCCDKFIPEEYCSDIEIPEFSSNESKKIEPAKMWTRTNMQSFKEEVLSGEGDGIINLGHGEIITVRIPTHEAGKCIFWEFSTDDYDIGFGIYFEWCVPISSEVTISVGEIDEEELNEDIDEDEQYTESMAPDDFFTAAAYSNIQPIKSTTSVIVPMYRRECHKEVYAGSHVYPGQDEQYSESMAPDDFFTAAAYSNIQPIKSTTSVIVPMYRRECHKEVDAGSHVYPGQGIYLLEFDNSYSLWRS